MSQLPNKADAWTFARPDPASAIRFLSLAADLAAGEDGLRQATPEFEGLIAIGPGQGLVAPNVSVLAWLRRRSGRTWISSTATMWCSAVRRRS